MSCQASNVNAKPFIGWAGSDVLDQAIQQNASFSEEGLATAKELVSQAESLRETIAFFQTEEPEKASNDIDE